MCTDAVGIMPHCLKDAPLYRHEAWAYSSQSSFESYQSARGNVLYEINIQPAQEVWKNETAEAAGYHDFAAILIFDCAVRQLMLVDNFGESVARVKRVPARCTHSELGDVW